MRTVITLLALSVLISACGYKGPLYMPKDAPVKTQETP
ncbi:LPS translocon maturation chaperone LptM [Craterilacuibacter sp.]